MLTLIVGTTFVAEALIFYAGVLCAQGPTFEGLAYFAVGSGWIGITWGALTHYLGPGTPRA